MKCLRKKTEPSTTRRTWLGRLWNQQGAELVEAAMVLPMLLALLLGAVWFGRAYNIYQTITRAAREGARFALAPSCATCGNTFPTDTDVTTVINNALTAASLDASQVNPAISIQRNQTLATDSNGNKVNGVVITFGYPVSFIVPLPDWNKSNPSSAPVGIKKSNTYSFTVNTQVRMIQEF